ncbi:hypothetical protein FZEAL_8636 [Fusarium zealandicum]|uniref:Methyltransferase domain-containing protein n=1 Tax=Fusarium zealandicum TaxID=1053134 RepID=A0A8H4UDH0_9HYPO|nr:hypothetical protein FZEAL_8636 [Fusarium zealandicum]
MSNEELYVGLKDKQVPWFDAHRSIQEEARDLLENYGGIPTDGVDDHVSAMRDKIWQVFPYPCVGELGFLDLNLAEREAYPQIIARLRASPEARHLDIGCCVGQDIRKLVHDGVPSDQIVGVELERGYTELGYELFNDRATLKTRFVNADMLDTENKELKALNGTFDTIHIGLVLQLFNLEEQMQFLTNTIAKLKPSGGLIVGHTLAHQEGIEVPGAFNKPNMRHNWETWIGMWDEIESRVGREIKMKGCIDGHVGFGERRGKETWRDRKWRRIVFEVIVK